MTSGIAMHNFDSPMLEGLGDVVPAERIYSNIYPVLYRSIANHLDDLYSLVTGQKQSVRILLSNPGSIGVRFRLGTISDPPGYIASENSISMPIAIWLKRAGWPVSPDGAIKENLGKDRFVSDMKKSLSYGLKSALSIPSVARVLCHELVHFYDFMTKRNMMVDRDFGPSTVPTHMEKVRNELFPQTYSSYSGNDRKLLGKCRKDFSKDDFDAYMSKSGPNYDALMKRSSLYKRQSYMSTNAEMRARIGEQLAWLVLLRKDNSVKLNVQKTVEHMLDHTFAIPDRVKDMPKRFRTMSEMRHYAFSKVIMPGALRSVVRRLAKLVISVNELDVSSLRTVPERLRGLCDILDSYRQ